MLIFFFNDTATTEIYTYGHTLSLHDALPICEARADPTAQAEILAIRRAAAAMGTPRLTECDLYGTLEPCPMCAQATAFARLRRLYYGAEDPKGGCVDNGPRIFAQPTCHHSPAV